MEWIETRLNSTEVDDFNKINTLFSDKNIIIGPEGLGKSTKILERVLTDFTSPSITVYSAHTIDNSNEKYKYLNELKNKLFNNGKEIYLIESDVELFRKMIKAQSEDLYTLLKKTMNSISDEYLQFTIFSINHDNKELSRIDSKKYEKVVKSALEFDDTPNGYNSTLIRHLYNIFETKVGVKDYFLFFTTTKEKDEILSNNFAMQSMDFEKILDNYHSDLYSANYLLNKSNINVIRISSESIKNWRGFRMEREKIFDILKNNVKLTSNNLLKPCIIIAQNKTVENQIIPLLREANLINDTLLILDELTEDSFRMFDISLLKELEKIAKKVNKFGEESLSPADTFLLQDIVTINKTITGHNIKKAADFNITESIQTVRIGSRNVVLKLGIPFLCPKLQYFKNIIILTTEKLLASILTKSFKFKAYEIEKNFKVVEDNLNFYSTDRKSPLYVVKSNKNNISEYIQCIKNNYKSLDDTLILGTSYFNTDFTITSCKGRNYSSKKHVSIFKNPEPEVKFNKIIAFIKEFESEYKIATKEQDEELLQNVITSYNIDAINQTLGRFLGYRKYNHPNITIDFYYCCYDKSLIKSFDFLRYDGNKTPKINLDKKIKTTTDNDGVYFNLFNKLKKVLSIYSDKDYMNNIFNSPYSKFDLNIILADNNLTYKGACVKISEYFKIIKNDFIQNEEYFKLFLNGKLSENYKDDTSNDDILDTIINNMNESSSTLFNDTIHYMDCVINKEFSKLDNIPNSNSFDISRFMAINFWKTYYKKLNNSLLLNYLRGEDSLIYTNMHSIEYIKTLHEWINAQSSLTKVINKEIFRFKIHKSEHKEVTETTNDFQLHGLLYVYSKYFPNSITKELKNNLSEEEYKLFPYKTGEDIYNVFTQSMYGIYFGKLRDKLHNIFMKPKFKRHFLSIPKQPKIEVFNSVIIITSACNFYKTFNIHKKTSKKFPVHIIKIKHKSNKFHFYNPFTLYKEYILGNIDHNPIKRIDGNKKIIQSTEHIIQYHPVFNRGDKAIQESLIKIKCSSNKIIKTNEDLYRVNDIMKLFCYKASLPFSLDSKKVGHFVSKKFKNFTKDTLIQNTLKGTQGDLKDFNDITFFNNDQKIIYKMKYDKLLE